MSQPSQVSLLVSILARHGHQGSEKTISHLSTSLVRMEREISALWTMVFLTSFQLTRQIWKLPASFVVGTGLMIAFHGFTLCVVEWAGSVIEWTNAVYLWKLLIQPRAQLRAAGLFGSSFFFQLLRLLWIVRPSILNPVINFSTHL